MTFVPLSMSKPMRRLREWCHSAATLRRTVILGMLIALALGAVDADAGTPGSSRSDALLNNSARPAEMARRVRELRASGQGALADLIENVAGHMVDVPPGRFYMGNAAYEPAKYERPLHLVNVRAFRMSAYEVTFKQYDAFAVATGRPLPSDAGWGRGDRPVINVAWSDGQAFIAWLNEKSAGGFRLPTEAEWEYAARAGSTADFPWGSRYDENMANGSGVSGRDRWNKTAPVGSFPPNQWKLYDMIGNVWEWTEDCWHPTYAGAPTDGSAWLAGDCAQRVTRGGSWGSGLTSYLWVSARFGYASIYSDQGFRLAQDE